MAIAVGLTEQETAVIATAWTYGYYQMLQMGKVPPIYPLNSDMSNPGENNNNGGRVRVSTTTQGPMG